MSAPQKRSDKIGPGEPKGGVEEPQEENVFLRPSFTVQGALQNP